MRLRQQMHAAKTMETMPVIHHPSQTKESRGSPNAFQLPPHITKGSREHKVEV